MADPSLCPLTLYLDTPNLQQTVPSTIIQVDQTGTITLNPSSNTQIQTIDTATGAINCDLSDLTFSAYKECTLDYEVRIESLNGTLGLQTSGQVTIQSECLSIPLRYPPPADPLTTAEWALSQLDPLAHNPAIAAGYEVRGA